MGKSTERQRSASSFAPFAYFLFQVIKQTVMTIVYGVTFVGGREQIKVSLLAIA